MPNKVPMVSIIIAAHNRPEYLIEALESLKRQTAAIEDFEVIVVKDYELDLSKINSSMMAITFIDTSDNELVSKHIAGIKASKGDFIALMDDDDLFSPIKIERILSLSQYMGKRSLYINAKQFFTNSLDTLSILSNTSITSFEMFEPAQFHSRRLIQHDPWYNLSSMTIGRDLALEGSEIIRDFKREIDPLWYIIALERADKIVYDRSRLTLYRRHLGGVSRSGNKNKTCIYAKQAIESYDKMENIFRNKVALDTVIAMRAEWYIKATSLGCKFRECNFLNTFLSLLKSLRYHSIKDVSKLLLLLLLSRVNVRISSNIYPKLYL